MNENGEVALYGYHDDASMELSSKNIDNPKSYVKGLEFLNKDLTNVKTSMIGDVLVRQLQVNSSETTGIQFYIASAKRYYFLSVQSKTRDNPSATKFLESVQLETGPLFGKTTTPVDGGPPTIIERLASSPIVKAALEKTCSDKITYGFEKKGAVLRAPHNDGLVSRRLILLRKVKAHNPKAYFSGTRVVVRALFRADGCIRDVIVVGGGNDDEIMEAIKAVAQIRFLPAEIAGKAVDVMKAVEYQF